MPAPVSGEAAEIMGRNPPSQLKRAREQALKERRERKRVSRVARDSTRSTPAEHDLPPTENLADTRDGLVEPHGDRNDATDEIST